MKNLVFLLAISAVSVADFACADDSTPYDTTTKNEQAAAGKGKSKGNKANADKKTSSSSSNRNGCQIVGIQDTKEYLTRNQRTCFNKASRAEAAGYTLYGSGAVATPTAYVFTLTGAQEVPAVTTAAAGTCYAVLNATETKLVVTCDHTVTGPIAAHIHTGAAGANGAVLCPATSAVSPLVIDCTLTASSLASLKASELYVNVHSTTNTGGEIRGQVDND